MYQQVATPAIFKLQNENPDQRSDLSHQSIETLIHNRPQQDPAIAALLESLDACPKLKQRMNGNRRARRSIRVKRMRSQSHVLAQKRSKGFACAQTEPTDTGKPKVLRSHAAQTALKRYHKAKTLVEGVQPTFTSIASQLPNGNAPTDLSMGWDGSLWAIDKQGAPHLYDPINNEWNVHGEGIDAAAGIDNTLYLFQGDQYVTVNASTQQTSRPVEIAETWPNLPRSFQLGVTGAANVNNTLYLFKGGWYLPVDGSKPRAKLIDVPGWPTKPNWVDGVIDAVFVMPGQSPLITLRHGQECVDLEVSSAGALQVKGSPRPVNSGTPLAEIKAGAMTVSGETPTYFYYIGVLVQINTNALQYLPTLHQNWPAVWNPQMTHAPSGRMGNLWVATTAGDIVHHDGETWNAKSNQAKGLSVSVGIDDSVWAAQKPFSAVYAASGIGGYDLQAPTDQSFTFDYDGSGKLDHLVFYRPGTGAIFILKSNGDGTFTPRYQQGDPGGGIGGYDLKSPADRGFAFDYDGSGKLDHLVFYRPSTGYVSIIKKNNDDTFSKVYDSSVGIGGFDLKHNNDRGFAFDYDGSGKQDHLVFYRPGTGAIFILKRTGEDFSSVYAQGDPGGGIGGWDLKDAADRGFAFDYDSSGKLDHLVFYRPRWSGIYIIKKNGDGSFTSVYTQKDAKDGRGIGGYDLSDPADRGFAFDYDGSGKQNYFVFYRPGSKVISILKNTNGSFSKVYDSSNGIEDYDLLSTSDQGFAFDFDGSGKQDHLIFYRPGAGLISILKHEADSALASWDGNSWIAHPLPPGSLTQVSVGDATRVWARDNQGNVLQYTNQQCKLNAQVGQAAHISANNDGTLWHCNNTPNAHRLVSESTAQSEQLVVNSAITSVQRVATTGFGSAHCLAQHSDGSTAVYRYDSPYVFKTSKAYQGAMGITSGFGKIYVTQGSLIGTVGVSALDVHTGKELATYSITVEHQSHFSWLSSPVLDPINELVYVTYYADSVQAKLLALDAHTLNLRWVFPLGMSPYQTEANPPVLSGTRLCVGDYTTGILYMFDARAASTTAPGGSPQPLWQTNLTQTTGATIPLSPAIVSNRVYTVVQNNNALQLVICDAASGAIQQTQDLGTRTSPSSGLKIVTNSALTDSELEIYIPGGNGILIARPFANQNPALFQLPGGTSAGVRSDITYDDGSRVGKPAVPSQTARLWFGDSLGNLWSINPANAQATDNTPVQVIPNTYIYTAPVIYKDSKGGATVFFGMGGGTDANPLTFNLYGYDPDSHNTSSIPTGVTSLRSLHLQDNGVLYTGGVLPHPGDLVTVPQVFGIRVDMLVQSLRDFIIESQLLQDPDETATGGSTDKDNPIPPSIARYQTHLAVMDDHKAPRPNETIKIWADKPNTAVTINGKPYTIGPSDSAFAAVQTGADGTLTLVSNATDMFATPLRVWASFMNSYERIVVNPDQEAHQRVTTAHSDATDTNPDKVNLAAGKTYKGTTLFTQDEVNSGQPKNAADAIGQMKQGINLGGTSTSTRLTYSRLMQGSRLIPHSRAGLKLAAAQQSYVAYSDLHGMGYFATNVPSQRSVTPVKAVGFKYSAADKTTAGTNAQLTIMSHTDALQEIDNLKGTPWKPSAEATLAPRRLGNWWTDFWSWLTDAVDKLIAVVKDIVTAIGDVVTVGISMLVKGIETVFHCKIQFLEDIASAIGSFFTMLEKVIGDVLEAFSVLFHFGEIIWTQKWIESYLINQVLSLKQTVKDTVIPKVDGFFQQGKDAIKQAFSGAIAQAPNHPISQQQGVGSSSHTVYNVGPKGSNTSSSHAVQCNWGTQKMQNGLPSSSTASSFRESVGGDPVSDFFSGFIQSLTNGDLSNDFSDFKSSFNSMFQSTSVSSFFQNALNSFLGLIEGLLELMLDIADDLTTGLLKIFDDAIDLLIGSDGKSGILNETIDIPFLSWLFKTITGEDLTLLNLITLVIAIPVTVVFRVINGQYPSAAGLPQVAQEGAQVAEVPQAQLTALPTILQEMLAFVSFALSVAGGAISAFADGLTGVDPDASDSKLLDVFSKLYAVVSLLSIPLALPLISNDPGNLQDTDWISFGLTASLCLLSLLGLITPPKGSSVIYGVWQTFLLCILSTGALAISCIAFQESGSPGGWAGVSFAIAIFSVVAGIINPIKLITPLEEITIPVVVAFDFLAPIIAGAMTIADVMGTANNSTAEAAF